MNKIALVLMFTSLMFAEGTIGGVTYFDYTTAEETSAFNFNRQYFSYKGVASDQVTYKVVFDVDRTDNGTVEDCDDGECKEKLEDTRLVAFLKKAQIDYKTSFGKFNFGLIGMNTYGVQEKNWGYRFIEKSSIDKNKFSSTADIGIGFSKSILDNLNLSLQVVNGEGYKKPQNDKYHKITFNTTYGERKLNKNDGYNIGVVYTTESTDNDPTTMTSVFGGFAGMGIRIGAEYDLLTDEGVKSIIISVSANYGLFENMDIFTRYDIFDEDTSVEEDGENYLIAGVLIHCGSGLSVAPNMRMTSFEDNANDSETEYKISFQFKF